MFEFTDAVRAGTPQDFAEQVLEIVLDQDDASPLFDRLIQCIDHSKPLKVTSLKFAVTLLMRNRLMGLNDEGEDAVFPHDGTPQEKAVADVATLFACGVLIGHEHARRGYVRPGPLA